MLFVEIPSTSWYKQKGFVYIETDLFEKKETDFMEIDENVTSRKISIDEVIKMSNNCVFDA